MATAEEVRQELNDAKVQLQEAKDEVKEFKGRYGQRLTDLENKLWGSEGTPAQQQRWEKEKDELKAEKKSLEESKEERLKQVEKLQDRLTAATTQPGNDFVTRALGT